MAYLGFQIEGPTKFSFREKGEKRGHGGRRRSKSVPPIFSPSEGGLRAKSGGMGWGRVGSGPNRYPLNNFFLRGRAKAGRVVGGFGVARGPFLPYASIMPLLNTPLITPWIPRAFY